jgi:hypothetical protein
MTDYTMTKADFLAFLTHDCKGKACLTDANKDAAHALAADGIVEIVTIKAKYGPRYRPDRHIFARPDKIEVHLKV